MSEYLTLGTHNIHYMLRKRDLFYDPSWEVPNKNNGKGKKRWLNAHDVAIFTDTKMNEDTYSHLGEIFPGFNLFNEFAHDNKWGVTIMTRTNLTTEKIKLTAADCTKGRVTAVEINIPTLDANISIKIGVVGVYAPDSRYTADEIRIFFTELKRIVALVKGRCDYVYVGGDFNAVTDNIKDSFNYRRAPHIYPQDVCLQRMIGDLNLTDPLESIDPQHNAKDFYSFKSFIDKDDPLDTTYRRIDHILAGCGTGITNYYLDPERLSNPLRIENSTFDSISDHTPVSLTINLMEMNNAKMPEKFELRVIKRTRYPEVDASSSEWLKCKDRFDNLRNFLDDECLFLLDHRNLFENAEEVDKNNYTEVLNRILGKILPEPFKKSFTPGVNRWMSKDQMAIRRRITKVKRIRYAVNYLIRNTDAPMSVRKTRAKHKANDPIIGVTSPSAFLDQGLGFVSNEYKDWWEEMENIRKALWVTYNIEAELVKKERSEWFREMYKKEASKMSRKLRIVSYPKDKQISAIVILVDGEKIVTDKEGILHEYKATWEKLGRKPEVVEGSRPMNDKLKDFIDDNAYAHIRESVKQRNDEITKVVTAEMLRAFVMNTPNKACNPLDEIEVITLKHIFGWDLGEALNPQEHTCTILQTLILGLVNSVLTTGYFPAPLMRGVVIPLYKNGDIRDLNNYRGITLLSTLYKLVTKIINTRLLQICEESGALSQFQAGGRANMSCLTQVTVLQNVIKHSHRNNKPLFILSTDVRKAFDTVDHEAFLESMRVLGFGENVINLIKNLQSNFRCAVNTPLGLTEEFLVEQGCKQGCAVSPLRFIILYDIFLKFLQHSGKGYKWECFGSDETLTIPAEAFMDDMILLADNEDDFCYMVEKFDDFLKAVGLSLNAKKCHYTSINSYDVPEIWCTDPNGERIPIIRAHESVPLTYLGYIIKVENLEGKLTETWHLHNKKIETKMRKAVSKFVRSRFQPEEAINILNADIMSIFPYFAYANWMPSKSRKAFDDLGKTVSLASIQSLMRKAAVRKLRLLPNTPSATIFNRSRGVGFGVNNIKALYFTAKVDNMMMALQSPSRICRMTTLDSIQEILANSGWNILKPNPEIAAKSVVYMSKFPAFYRECGLALQFSKTDININEFFSPLAQTHPLVVINDHIPKNRRSTLCDVLKRYRMRSFSDLVPGTVNSHTTNEDLTNTKLQHTMWNDHRVREMIMETGTCRKEFDALRLLPRYLSKGLKEKVALGAFQDINDKSWWKSGILTHAIDTDKIGTDGSFKDGKAGWGLSCSQLALFAPVAGRQGIDVAEASAILAAVQVATPNRDIQIVIDSQSSIDIVKRVREQIYNPKGYRTIANYSIIKTIVDLIEHRERVGGITTLVKVKSHTNAVDENSLLNEEADKAANLGRTAMTNLIGPCLHNLPRAYLGSGGQIWETKTHAEMYKRLDAFLLQKELDSVRASKHLKLWDMEDIWREANFVGKNDNIKIFRCKMYCKSLPTPRNIQILNMVKFPMLYPNFHCPLCDEGEVGDDFHIFCKCPALEGIRSTVAQDCKNTINPIIDKVNNTVSLGLMKFCLFPRSRENFKQGNVHSEMEKRVRDKVGGNSANLLARHIGNEVSFAYHKIWGKYTDILAERKLNLDGRLRQVYNTSTRKIKKAFAFDNG